MTPTTINASHSSLLHLPIEVIRDIAIHLHPHEVLLLPILNKQAWFSLHFSLEFTFARSNLNTFAHSRSPDPRLRELSRIFKSINFDRLGIPYWSALISLFGLTETTFYLLYPHYDPPPPRPRPHPDPIISALMQASTSSTFPHPDLTLDEHFALMWVSSTDQVPDMITLLTKLPETPLPDMEKFLQCAAAFGAITMVTHFLNLGVDPTTEDNLALRLAAENGHAEVVALLVAHDADAAADTDHALRTASENGHKEVVKVLLGVPTVNPASVNNASIVEASSNGHVEIVRMLMETGRVELGTALWGAASGGHRDVVEVLVESGMVDPNERVGDAIKVAIENGHVEVVKALRRFEVGWRGKEVEGRVGSVLEAVEVLNGDVYSSSASETDIAVAREVEGMIFYV